MIISPEYKIKHKLGPNWKIEPSTYEDGPPHRTKLMKRSEFRFLYWTWYSWSEAAWKTATPNNSSMLSPTFETYSMKIAQELENLDVPFTIRVV